MLQTAAYQDGEIGLAVERYDYIIGKYGTTDYPDFLSRGIRPIQPSQVIEPLTSESFMIFGAIALFIVGGFALYFLIRRKRA